MQPNWKWGKETPEVEYPNENDSEDTEINKNSKTPNFMPQILPDYEIVKGINYLNSKQREVFNVAHIWVKDYMKYGGHYVEPVHMFLSDSGGMGKSHLMKVIYNAISKALLYQSKDPDKLRVLIVGLTGRATIYFGVGINLI